MHSTEKVQKNNAQIYAPNLFFVFLTMRSFTEMNSGKIRRRNMQYDKNKMLANVDKVRRGFSIRRAARKYGILESTLRAKFSAGV